MGATALDVHTRDAKKALALAAYATGGTVLDAMEAAGTHRNTHYDWLKTDPDYAAGIEAAEQDHLNMLEREVERRGVQGIDEPLTHQGVPTGHYTKKYSDNLLMFRTKRLDPSYRDTAPPNAGASITFNIIAPPGVDPTTIDAVVVKPELGDGGIDPDSK